MYKVARRNRIIEQLGLCEKDGNPVAVLDIDIDVAPMTYEFNKAYNNAILAKQQIESLGVKDINYLADENPALSAEDTAKTTAALALYGDCVTALFNLLFGEDNTQQIIAFYDNRYEEMIEQIFPFIFDVVEPAMKQAQEDKIKTMQNNYLALKPKKKNRFKRK